MVQPSTLANSPFKYRHHNFSHRRHQSCSHLVMLIAHIRVLLEWNSSTVIRKLQWPMEKQKEIMSSKTRKSYSLNIKIYFRRSLFMTVTTVPLKGKLTVTRESQNSTQHSILHPRKFRESSLKWSFVTRELALSSFESRKIMSLLVDLALKK